MSLVLIISLVVFLVLGLPVAISLGLSAVLAILYEGGFSLTILAQRSFTALDSFPLMAIPFFILAGALMEHGGMSKRLIEFAKSIFGHVTGGLAIVTVFAAMIFSAISGSGAATVAALGAILIPAMIKEGYDRGYASSVQAISGELGAIIPPSIPMILFAVSTGTSTRDMFLAGVIPGLLVAVALMIFVYISSKIKKYPVGEKYTWRQRGKAFMDSIWALLLPIIVLGGIYGGIFTPTEASAVAVVYAFLVGTFIYREITVKKYVEILKQASILTAIILFIVANVGLFSWVLNREGIPQQIAGYLSNVSDSPIVFLLLVNVLLLLVGMVFDNAVATIILAPILTPAAVALGIDPIHFGMIMVVNLAIGMCTPPVGVNLFIACQLANIKLGRITVAILPFLAVVLLSLLIITFVPAISLWLPSLFN